MTWRERVAQVALVLVAWIGAYGLTANASRTGPVVTDLEVAFAVVNALLLVTGLSVAALLEYQIRRRRPDSAGETTQEDVTL